MCKRPHHLTHGIHQFTRIQHPRRALPSMTARDDARGEDIWSAGVVLFAMAAGKMPFGGERVGGTPEGNSAMEPSYPGHLSSSMTVRLLNTDRTAGFHERWYLAMSHVTRARPVVRIGKAQTFTVPCILPRHLIFVLWRVISFRLVGVPSLKMAAFAHSICFPCILFPGVSRTHVIYGATRHGLQSLRSVPPPGLHKKPRHFPSCLPFPHRTCCEACFRRTHWSVPQSLGSWRTHG